jgi:hypothetical protein
MVLKAAAALTAVALLAACGGSSEPTIPAEAPEAPASPEAATVDVSTTIWFAGFEVEVGTAAFDPADGTVSVDAMFTNTGDEPAVMDATLTLASGGSFTEPIGVPDIPQVPGDSTGTGSMTFAVDETFSFEDATLTFGTSGINQAVVPLGTGEAVTLEPASYDVAGDAEAGSIAIDLAGAEARADVPADHLQIAEGSLALTLGFDVTNHGSYEGGFAFAYGTNLALELPDGTTIAPDEGPIELLQLGTTLPDQTVRFTVPDPVAGTYALVLIDDTNDASSQVRFRI